MGSRETRGDEEKIKLEADDFSPVLNHIICFCAICPPAETKKVTLALHRGELNSNSTFAFSSLNSTFSHFAYSLAQSSLETLAMALRCICQFSARPPINDPAKRRSHRSQAALTHHHSGSIGCIAVSFPVGWAGEEMSRDKQLSSQIPSREEGVRTAVVEKKRSIENEGGKVKGKWCLGGRTAAFFLCLSPEKITN